MAVCPITGDVNFGYLIKGVSVEFFCYQIIFFPFNYSVFEGKML